MRSALHALLWDSFRYAGWAQAVLLAACLLPLAIYAMITSVAIGPGSTGLNPNDPVMVLLKGTMLPFIMFLLIMGAGTVFAKMSLLYTKPLSNLSIAAWSMIGGAIMLAVQVALLVQLYNGIYNAGWPLAGAVLFVIAVWLAAQPFFCLAGKTILGTIVTMLPIALVCVWCGHPKDWNEISVSGALQLLAIIPVFAWCTVRSVALARRGDGLPWLRDIGEWFAKLFDWQLPVRSDRAPFRSAGAAMFWYEWRWKGWALSAAMLLLLAIIVPVQLYESFSLQSFYDGVCGAYMGTMLPAMIMGVMNGFQLEGLQISLASGRTTRLNEIDELGSFQATRPVTDAKLSRSNLWVCLASIGLMTAIWLLFVSPTIILAASQGQLQQLFARHQFFVVPLVGVFMWVTMSNITSLTTTGRTLQLGGCIIALGVAFVALLSVLEWIGNKQIEQIVLQSLAAIFTVTLLAFAIWAYVRSLQLGFVTRGGLAIVSVVFVTTMVIGCYLVTKLDVSSIVGVLCTAILCVLPWATTPLATRWNRHR